MVLQVLDPGAFLAAAQLELEGGQAGSEAFLSAWLLGSGLAELLGRLEVVVKGHGQLLVLLWVAPDADEVVRVVK